MESQKKSPRIIITRPEADARAFAGEARAAGFTPVIAPVMEIVHGARPPSLAGVGALAFTSANGVRAFAAVCGAPAIAAFAVGGITAQAAAKAGFAALTVAGGDVESLAASIAAAAAEGRLQGRVLHIAGSDRAGDLVGALRAAGLAADLAVLYEARPAPQLAAAAAAALASEPPAEAVALFSPRSARLFIDQARQAGLAARLDGVIAACLSEAVAAAAGDAAWRRTIVADERSGESLLSTLLREIEQAPG